jgi:pimeloyl-ACP methyl ester carboxylesterase
MAMRMALKYPDLIDRLIIVDFAPVSYHSVDKYKVRRTLVV